MWASGLSLILDNILCKSTENERRIFKHFILNLKVHLWAGFPDCNQLMQPLLATLN